MVPQILRWSAFALALFTATPLARAQDGATSPGGDARITGASVDLHGQLPSAPQGVAGEPLLSWAPPALDRRWSLSAQLEYARDPLQIELQPTNDDEWRKISALANLAGANLSARWSPVSRVGIALTVPVFAAEVAELQGVKLDYDSAWTFAVPDVRVALPIGIAGSPDGSGAGIGLVPYLGVPTGIGGQLLNGSELSYGALFTTGWRGEPIALTGNVGVGKVPVGDVLALPTAGPIVGLLSAAVGRELLQTASGPVWGNLELRVMRSLSPVATPEDALYEVLPPKPSAELLLTMGGKFGRGFASLGGGSHVTRAPGAASFRGLATIGVSGASWGGLGEDGARPREPISFVVVNPEGDGVSGAVLVLDGIEAGRTDALGQLTLETLGDKPASRWKSFEVAAENFEPLAGSRPPEVSYPLELALAWKPAVLDATVTDPEGKPVEVLLTARPKRQDGSLGDPVTGKPGELMLPPGTYQVEIEAEGQATQLREVVVPSNGAPPKTIQAISVKDAGGAALTLRIEKPEGGPVVGARVLVDGVPVGTTTDGGLLQIIGFSDGVHRVEIQHDAFTSSVMDLDLSPDRNETPVVLDRVPGTVRVLVKGPDGAPVRDAVIRYVGPSRLAPMAVGPTGERIDVLSPGEWVLVVSSGDYGVQERDIFIPPDRYELLTVEVQLRPVEEGTSELDLRVVDPSGTPVEGVTVKLGEDTLGTTSTGGTIRLARLAPGLRTLTIVGEGVRERQLPLELQPGVNSYLATVSWDPGIVDVVVRGPSGTVPDAVVRFTGPKDVAPARIGNTGRLRTQLAAGSWTAVVTSTEYGLQERDFVLEPASGSLTTLEFVLQPVEEGLAQLTVRVVGPEGEPLEGASVALDSQPLGTTSNAGTIRVEGLQLGPRRLEVAAPAHRAEFADLRLLEGEQQAEMSLDWADGAVKVRVRHAGKPVTDAVVRLFGPTMTPPAPVDTDGEWLGQVSEPQELWVVVVTSPTLGLAEQDLLLKSSGLTQVDVEMFPPAAERTDLQVTVLDQEGHGVEHAKVLLDNTLVEQTEQGGTVLSRGLAPGPARLRVEAPDFVTSDEIVLELRPGKVESFTVRLAWSTTDVQVITLGPDGLPIDARVQWRDGPTDVLPQQSGEKGTVTTALRPGSWHVYATVSSTVSSTASASGGDLAAEAALVLELGDTPRPIELRLSPSGASMVGDAVTIQEMVQFDFGQATLRSDSEVILTEVARVLKSQPTLVKVQVEGHTDNVGSIEVNQALSQARAEAVRAALIERGVAPEMLAARGFASTQPLGDNTTEEGRSKNRRVQFVVKERGAVVPEER
jgi:outer membrane protein OmpA-like peptidoglycan-associated protein